MLDKQKRFFIGSLTALLFVAPLTGMTQAVSSDTEIGTCEECVDAAETNVLSGTLKAISFKTSMLQLATSDGTSVVTFDDNTIITGADDLSSIKTGSNLEIEYLKKDGVLLAVGIEGLVERPVVLESNEIDAKTLADLLSDNTTEVTLIDARSASSFEKEHIPGAISIYTGEFDKNIDKLPADKDQLIVYYCDGTNWKLSAKSARRAEKNGYTNVKVLYGGLPGWKQAGYKASSKNTGQTQSTTKPLDGVVDSEEFIRAARSRSQDIVLLDVRSDEEIEQGVIPGSLTIPADEVSDRLVEIPAGKQIYIFCKSGIRAEMVYYLLKDKGIPSKYLKKNVSVDKQGSFFINGNTRNQ